jgi:hypothetical protein
MRRLVSSISPHRQTGSASRRHPLVRSTAPLTPVRSRLLRSLIRTLTRTCGGSLTAANLSTMAESEHPNSPADHSDPSSTNSRNSPVALDGSQPLPLHDEDAGHRFLSFENYSAHRGQVGIAYPSASAIVGPGCAETRTALLRWRKRASLVGLPLNLSGIH